MIEATVTAKRRKPWYRILIVVALCLGAGIQLLALFQEPEARAISLGYFACGAAALLAWKNRERLQRFGRPGTPGAGRRFVLIGSLGAAGVEFAFWAAEKLTGAVGVAASPNLFWDLLVTMPWYVAMIATLWWVQKRFRYSWTTIALLGGLYEIGGDGFVGHLLSGNPIRPGYLLTLFFVYYWIFVVVYAPMVLPPVWAMSFEESAPPRPLWQRVLGALVPLGPLVPYWIILSALFA
jgi:hypothetical protein